MPSALSSGAESYWQAASPPPDGHGRGRSRRNLGLAGGAGIRGRCDPICPGDREGVRTGAPFPVRVPGARAVGAWPARHLPRCLRHLLRPRPTEIVIVRVLNGARDAAAIAEHNGFEEQPEQRDQPPGWLLMEPAADRTGGA
jgi:hypothetical protein